MVPVLSSSNTSTSPAASTARPEVASTLARTSRSMPAMPIADKSPPMVVGMRHTNNAVSTVNVTGAPPEAAAASSLNGRNVTTASKKMIVNAAKKMSSAISFGVFLRLAPSTMLIMRSRNVSPGFAVILTTNQSLNTRVPPVTAERSPPDSRMTGALSPVMADSSTDATPYDVSVAGDQLARFDEHDVAAAERRGRCDLALGAATQVVHVAVRP